MCYMPSTTETIQSLIISKISKKYWVKMAIKKTFLELKVKKKIKLDKLQCM